jgi:hypothetical protein
MPRKLSRQEAMAEVIDALCPLGPIFGLKDAQALAAVCEAVAALYEQDGALYAAGLGLVVKPAGLKDAFWETTKTAARERERTILSVD